MYGIQGYWWHESPLLIVRQQRNVAGELEKSGAFWVSKGSVKMRNGRRSRICSSASTDPRGDSVGAGRGGRRWGRMWRARVEGEYKGCCGRRVTREGRRDEALELRKEREKTEDRCERQPYVGRKRETVDAVLFGDLEIICLLKAEKNVKKGDCGLKAKEKWDRCINNRAGKQEERMVLVFDVSQMGRQGNVKEGMNRMASEAERGYVIGTGNVLDGCLTNVWEPGRIANSLWGGGEKQEVECTRRAGVKVHYSSEVVERFRGKERGMVGRETVG